MSNIIKGYSENLNVIINQLNTLNDKKNIIINKCINSKDFYDVMSNFIKNNNNGFIITLLYLNKNNIDYVFKETEFDSIVRVKDFKSILKKNFYDSDFISKLIDTYVKHYSYLLCMETKINFNDIEIPLLIEEKCIDEEEFTVELHYNLNKNNVLRYSIKKLFKEHKKDIFKSFLNTFFVSSMDTYITYEMTKEQKKYFLKKYDIDLEKYTSITSIQTNFRLDNSQLYDMFKNLGGL